MDSKKWLKNWFVIVILFGILPYAFVYTFLKMNGENNTFKEIVGKQLKHNSIYGTALNQNTFSYKLELIEEVKPKVIALGSSRVMQFRKESFNTSFINAGGAMNYLNEGYLFLDAMYKVHRPEYIILGLDFWWFNHDHYQPSAFPYHNNNGTTITFSKIRKTFSWLFNGKISLLREHKNYFNLGFDAIKYSTGFRSDGSYFYAKTLFGVVPSSDERFSDTFDRIEKGGYRFEFSDQLDTTRVAILEKILKLIETHKTKVLILLPPVANGVYQKLDNSHYSYIKALQKYLPTLDKEIYDHHYLSTLTENDCECIDGFHGGDIIYKRILRDIYTHHSTLREYLNIDEIDKSIATFSGHTLSILKSDPLSWKEVDFLKLGCKK